MKYNLNIPQTNYNKNNPTLRDINICIDNLSKDRKDSFIVLDKLDDSKHIEFLQVNYYYDYDKEKEIYRIEYKYLNCKNPRQYKYETNDKGEVKKYYEDYIIHNITPDVNKWQDITIILKEEEKLNLYVNILSLAQTYYRDNRKIFNCYNFAHGENIDGYILYQSIAEALILFFDIVSNNGMNKLLYTKDMKRISITFSIPTKWEIQFKNISTVKSHFEENCILISYYKNNDTFIKSNIRPLTKLNRLIPCFLLLIFEIILKNEKELFLFMNYLSKPNKREFITLYKAISSLIKDEGFFVWYADFDTYYNDTDYSKFYDFNEIINNYKSGESYRQQQFHVW